MAENLFDSLEGIAARSDGEPQWSARAPFRPTADFDLMLVPRVRDWRQDAEARAALERIAAAPWAEELVEQGDQLRLRLGDAWIATAGERLEGGGEIDASHADLAAGRRYAVYFWGANTTKALHIGHMRNLAIGNAIGASLSQAGAEVEHRSLICDVGRSMGEAMAGIVEHSGPSQPNLGPDGSEKSDHFVGSCYAQYVTAGRQNGGGDDGAEDSVAREEALYNDKADELMMRVLAGDQEALELWSKTRAWVIAGQRKTLARLGIAFDKVIFESDFLPEVREFTNRGLSEGTLTRRRGDEMVMYLTAREELEEMPLVRADGLPTQHMRALAYWAAAPELDDVISLQVCGTEWVAHVTCRRQLIDALGAANANGFGSAKGGGPPTHDVFHGMVAREREAITSSKEGALLIDDLAEWVEAEIEADPARAAVRDAHPRPGGAGGPGRARLLPPAADEQAGRLRAGEAAGRRQQPRLGPGAGAGASRWPGAAGDDAAAADPEYRFAVVQSENYRVHLRSAVETFDTLPLARYLSHFGRWYGEEERSPAVERVAQAVLDQGVRGLGLEGV